jgi:hypothetical protein
MKLFRSPTSSSQQVNADDPDAIDAEFDDADQTGTKEENTVVSEQSEVEERSFMKGTPSNTLTIPETLDETQKSEGDSLEKVLSKFDLNCCFKNPTKQIVESEPETLKVDDEPEDECDDPSLSEIAARMKDVDLESGKTGEDDFYTDTDITKQLYPWYREPFYAGMIVLCILFTIAIIVMSVLLFKN